MVLQFESLSSTLRMDTKTAVENFKNILKEQPDVSPAIVALKVLLEFLKQDTSETIQGLDANMKSVIDAFMKVEGVVTSVKSASELFLRYITFTSLDHSDFKECKKVLVERGEYFLEDVSKARSIIARISQAVIKDGLRILIHSYSRVVYDALVEAHKANKSFHVYVSESAPDLSGRLMYTKLKEAGINCTLIIDAAISAVIEEIDVVLLGAEGVVESGGIINKVGTYGLAFIANSMNKKVFVLAESFKFVRIFPMHQRDLPNELKLLKMDVGPPEKSVIDYTPPKFITLLFTNLGILTTSAVGEELIKLYM